MPLGNSSSRIPGFQQIRRLRLLGPVSLEQPGVTRIHLGLAGPLVTRTGPVFRKSNDIVFILFTSQKYGKSHHIYNCSEKQRARQVSPSVSTISHLPEYMRNDFLLFMVFWPNYVL